MIDKWIYSFNDKIKIIKIKDKNITFKEIFGGKGASLLQMSLLDIPVPPGFTIITNACKYYNTHGEKKLYKEIHEQVISALKEVENILGKKFGDKKNPLLISVRSGAKISMPGMMDTILNLGLNDETVVGLAQNTNNERFAYDSYRRFIQMYGSVVMDVDSEVFESILQRQKKMLNIENDYELSIESLKIVISEYKNIILKETGKHLPNDVYDQLWNAIYAVFRSWNSKRAIKYREINHISHNLGTAVNIQSMVFGNRDNNSCTGVVFTRNPNDGGNDMFGEFLINAQGEDVVTGMRDTQPINIATKKYKYSKLKSMEEILPDIYKELSKICNILEKYYKDMQDIEFTVEQGKLWILQARNGKRNIDAAFNISINMMKDGIMLKKDALNSINANAMDRLLHPIVGDISNYKLITRGLAASPGAASGHIVFESADAENQLKQSKSHKMILVRTETSPEDIGGMDAAQGILTTRGGMTSHAAVVARGMGKPCVCGAYDLSININNKTINAGNLILKEGDVITINGSSGEVFLGEVPTIIPKLPKAFYELMNIADKTKKLDVYANAETEKDVKMALSLGATGVGLCRTEHMFFIPDRLINVRRMILADNPKEMEEALDSLIVYQKNDFKNIFMLTDGLPVVIRFLDPPLHEFLPKNNEEIIEYCRITKTQEAVLHRRISQLHEYNPMLGHRGCRLAITHPEIYKMQMKALCLAMLEIYEKNPNANILPEIMIPLVLDVKELEFCKNIIENAVAEIKADEKYKNSKYLNKLKYKFGTMIELPRAALHAGSFAPYVDFMSFGTNDLTQTCLGISRDDASIFLGEYIAKGILNIDPFITLDQNGVGELIQIAVERARKVKTKIKLGICGEHGGDPESIAFCHKLGFNYVSCSPYRIPTARLAAAQAAVKL